MVSPWEHVDGLDLLCLVAVFFKVGRSRARVAGLQENVDDALWFAVGDGF